MSQVIREFYDQNVAREWGRLDTPLSKIEFATGLRLIEKYFPAQSHVCDIGSGPGRYAIELIKRGHIVTLFDLSKELLQFANTRLKSLRLKAQDFIQGDARDLSVFQSDTFDASLVMGPMYHIIDARDRRAVLSELIRILRPGGTAIITYLNSWGLVRTGIVDFPGCYSDIAFLRSMLAEHIFKGQELANFTECYWSTPPAALSEVKQAGLTIVSYASAQGFAGGMRPLLEQLAAEMPEVYANVVEVAAETCELEQYRDTSEHLHIVARKPSGSSKKNAG